MAQAAVDLNWSLPSISQAMGIDHMNTGIAQGNVWMVPDVEQGVLDAALAAYDDGSTKLAIQWGAIRLERNAKLTITDWTQYADSPLTDADKATWATYRQALRDITLQSDPFDITWPTAPA